MLLFFADMKKLLAKPLKALASPGIYLFGKFNQYKREREESNLALTPTENELFQLNSKIVSNRGFRFGFSFFLRADI